MLYSFSGYQPLESSLCPSSLNTHLLSCLLCTCSCSLLGGHYVFGSVDQSPTYLVVVLVAQSCPTLCDPVDCSRLAPLSMGFSRQEYQSGLPFPSAGDLPDPAIEAGSPALQADSLPSELQGSPFTQRFLILLSVLVFSYILRLYVPPVFLKF